MTRGRRAPPKARLAGAIKAVGDWLRAIIAAQHDRWALWPPVGMIAGAAVWMTAPVTPPWWHAPAMLVVSAVIAWTLAAWPGTERGRLRMGAAAACVMTASFALGAVSAQVRTAIVATPRITRDAGPVRLTGWVMDVEPGATRPRMRVLVDAIEGVETIPRYVRVSVRADGLMPPGRAINCLVLLRAPEGPMAPHGYDFARRAFFQRTGATAIALGRCRPTDAAPPPAWYDRTALTIAAIRRDLTETILERVPDEGGAISAAMVTGDRSAMTSDTSVVFRDSGLGHLLSVSGLHMALVAGGIFAAMHFLLALIAPLALRFPIRKWAAAVALLGAGAYLVVSGASVPAQRAFVMTAVALGAVLIDRPAFTLRGLGVAAILIVLLSPESVVEPGFQMSFAATAALIAAFESRGPVAIVGASPGLLLGGLASSWRIMSDMLLASLVAGLATDPFAIFHFQRFSTYGLAANLAATPLITFVIAPAAVIAAALAPFGLADLPLTIMSGALDMVRAIGSVFADRPEAIRTLPAAPAISFLFAVGAIAWACLWAGALRWLALGLIVAAAISFIAAPQPVLWADGDLRAVVARTSVGWIVAGDPKRSAFAKARLGGLAGLSAAQIAKLAPPDGCDRDACAWRTPGGRPVIRIHRAEGLARACVTRAVVLSDIVLTTEFLARCRPALRIEPADLAAKGGLSIAETRRGLVVRRAVDDAGKRPWSGDLRRSDA